LARPVGCRPRRPTLGLGSVGSREALPNLPRRIAARVQVVEQLLVAEGVHALPETGGSVRDELSIGDQPLERLLHQLFSFLQIIENGALEGEEASVDPDVCLTDVADLPYASSLVRRNQMKGLTGAHA